MKNKNLIALASILALASCSSWAINETQISSNNQENIPNNEDVNIESNQEILTWEELPENIESSQIQEQPLNENIQSQEYQRHERWWPNWPRWWNDTTSKAS